MKLFGKWRKAEPAPTGESAAGAPGGKIPNGKEMPANVISADLFPDPDPLAHGRKVLIVDDNAVVLKAFELKLRACGFEVFTALEGSSAVSVARQKRPDLIVLDINFPPDVGSSGQQWNGFNILQWLRRFEEIACIPVIIITGTETPKARERALGAGAAGFFLKPINYDEFLVVAHRAMTQAAKPAKTP